MSVRLMFDKTAIIRRQRPINGTDRTKSMSTATVDVNIQKLDRETVQKIEGVFGDEYVLFCQPEVTIKEGDEVECKETSKLYRVTSVIKAEMMGIEHFKEVYITKLDEN